MSKRFSSYRGIPCSKKSYLVYVDVVPTSWAILVTSSSQAIRFETGHLYDYRLMGDVGALSRNR